MVRVSMTVTVFSNFDVLMILGEYCDLYTGRVLAHEVLSLLNNQHECADNQFPFPSMTLLRPWHLGDVYNIQNRIHEIVQSEKLCLVISFILLESNNCLPLCQKSH